MMAVPIRNAGARAVRGIRVVACRDGRSWRRAAALTIQPRPARARVNGGRALGRGTMHRVAFADSVTAVSR